MNKVATRADIAALYELHAAELHGYLYRRAGQGGADLLGEVFVVALQRMADLPEQQLRRAWLFGTARRLLLSQRRTVSRRTQAEEERARLLDPHPGTPAVTRTDRDRAVHEALDSLRETDRELIRLTEWEQLQVAEAAVVLGMRPGTARMRLLRASRALAEHPALRELASAEPTTAAADR